MTVEQRQQMIENAETILNRIKGLKDLGVKQKKVVGK